MVLDFAAAGTGTLPVCNTRHEWPASGLQAWTGTHAELWGRKK
jgi:hypothetical protein